MTAMRQAAWIIGVGLELSTSKVQFHHEQTTGISRVSHCFTLTEGCNSLPGLKARMLDFVFAYK